MSRRLTKNNFSSRRRFEAEIFTRDDLVIGTYRPGPETTGLTVPRESLTRSPASGTADLIVTTPGAIVENLDLYGRLLIRAANVKVRNCILRGRDSTTNEGCVDTTHVDCVNADIKDCIVRPFLPSIWTNGILGRNFVMTRCDISNMVDGCGVYNTLSPGTALNVRIDQNWFHDFTYFTPDSTHSTDNQTHNDGIQLQGGLGAIIRGNYIDCHYGTGGSHQPDNTASPSPSGFNNPAFAGILMNDNVGTTGNHIIEDNHFNGAYIPINTGDSTLTGNLGRIWRNTFSRDSVLTGSVHQTILLRSTANQQCDCGENTSNQNIFTDGTPVLVKNIAVSVWGSPSVYRKTPTYNSEQEGVEGREGPQGPQGEQGIQGLPGPKGNDGDIGPRGPAGDAVEIVEFVQSIPSDNWTIATGRDYKPQILVFDSSGVHINPDVEYSPGQVAIKFAHETTGVVQLR